MQLDAAKKKYKEAYEAGDADALAETPRQRSPKATSEARQVPVA
jgi:hypothetical protein